MSRNFSRSTLFILFILIISLSFKYSSIFCSKPYFLASLIVIIALDDAFFHLYST
ncbi:hypothetical protein GLOIN_2v1561036 [Rhizophagus irregularis DAOM 181602=DAOM 197198]|uniref:Uncharacterized protein n=1 Tax=Rhizophagus irregularis (strain DAOM 181602 / DAOM 197198 / MUCL 43194) TaxID=747089 RepID=A0A2P4QDX5_RHIID|nr:hypothetical protein GLOIN_2v1561036 [Rhizophagus irregularis DAOM 181602=DAOM 197198]POG75843.1 hypothetical protein GLOIN_2v1561036 [Rhizophagus irregularis DAOM 181602=DAOM 197198]|eukprot:XP_025182709.1 hypothetical protein GLOIN_2v1561036 [Rhizophagus irregularis DAOM 181602=DAOM 197198]